jgi:hypothetical protein
MEENKNCVNRKVSILIDYELFFNDILIEMEDIDTVASNGSMFHTTIDPIAMLKNKPERSPLKKTSIQFKNISKRTIINSERDSSDEDLGLDKEDVKSLTHAFDNRRTSSFSCTSFNVEQKKHSLSSESEVFEIIHLDANEHVSKNDR